MAIEPLGSAMTIQNQSIQKTEPVRPVEASTDASVQVEKNMIDPTTVTVQNVEKKGKGTNQEAQQGSNQQPTNEQIKQAVEKMNKSMFGSEAVFGIHEETNRVTIKIIDKETKEVIKELPPEKTLDMISRVWEMAGILVDEKR